MKILFEPANPSQVLIALEILRGLEVAQVPVELLAFHLDGWYCLEAAVSLRSHGVKFTEFPRKSGSGPIWKTHARRAIAGVYSSFLDTFTKVVEDFRPQVFFLFADHGEFEVGMLQVCRRLGVPSVFVQEGALGREVKRDPTDGNSTRPRRSLLQKAARKLVRLRRAGNPPAVPMPEVRSFGLNGADRLAVVNSRDARWFVEHGISADKITVTGHALMDRVWRSAQETTPKDLRGRSRIHVLVIGSGFAHFGTYRQHEWFVSQIREAVEKAGDRLEVSLRLKPGEALGDWKKVWRRLERSVRVLSSHDDLHPQIRAADVVVVSNSQVMMEALLLGRPVVNLVPEGIREQYRLAERGAMHRVNSGARLREILSGPKRTLELRPEQLQAVQACHEDFFHSFDGRAGARVAEVIRKAARSPW